MEVTVSLINPCSEGARYVHTVYLPCLTSAEAYMVSETASLHSLNNPNPDTYDFLYMVFRFGFTSSTE